MKARILIADDDVDICRVLAQALRDAYDLTVVHDAEAGLAALRDDGYQVVLTDIRMPGGGISLVQEVATRHPHAGVIVMSGAGSLEDHIGFIRTAEVFDYLSKPFTHAELRQCIVRCLEFQRLREENAELRARTGEGAQVSHLIGNSLAMRELKSAIVQVGPTDSTVLITGASGTGKELVARALHECSPRRGGAFVALNCGAIPAHLMESELFGHVKGAFTGAERTRAGHISEAEGGTLFLDEVATMTSDAQVRLLRALGSREITRVGEDVPRSIDVRIVAATNEDLRALVAAGRFREDLYYRLNVYPLQVPELVRRREDIPALAAHFVAHYCERIGRPRKELTREALQRLSLHTWPGNVRELENALQRAVILSEERPLIEVQDVLLAPPEPPQDLHQIPPQGLDLMAHLEEIERGMIQEALRRANGSRKGAADMLHLQRTTLVQKLKRYEEQHGAAEKEPAE